MYRIYTKNTTPMTCLGPDVVYLIDASGSVNNAEWALEASFLKQVSSKVTYLSDFHFALISYSTST